MSKRIKLTQNQYVLVDTEDYKKLNLYKWHANYAKNTGEYYARRNAPVKNGKHAVIYMHRVIMSAPRDLQVDHINHNTLDNRKQNLRLCTHGQNLHNQQLQKRKKSSKFKGVAWHKREEKWRAQIQINSKRTYLGYFKSEIQAAKAYNRKAKELFGKFALLNEITQVRRD